MIATLVTLGTPARADHDPSGHEHDTAPASSITGSVGVLAAAYDSMFFDGDYQGVTGSATYARGRFAVLAGASAYRLTKNGKTVRGGGDTMVQGHVNVIDGEVASAGFVLHVMLPTGDDQDGLGMGHLMVMPGVFGRWSNGSVSLGVSAGYGRGIGNESVHAEHGGPWPLVEPMNYHEVTFGGSASYRLANALRVGVRLSGAAPIGDGDRRLAGGVRTTWTEGRVETAFEIAAGLVGDPFSFRGVLESAIRFR